MKPSPRYTPTQNGSLVILILMLGVMTGFFWTYSFNVNVAMLQVSGEYYATMQSLLNVNVRNMMFFSFFFGSGLFGVLAILANLKHRKSLCFWLIVLAAATYIFGIIVFTKVINLPLNYYTESWDPQNLPADWGSVRDQWNQANLIRVGTSFASFLLAVLALFNRSLSKQN